jgi:hypothetical protein
VSGMQSTAATASSIVAAGVLLGFSAQSRDSNDVALRFLQNHGVPCEVTRKTDSSWGLDDAVTCEDGREWVLLWLEDEVAFVNPIDQQLYRWRVEIFCSYPEIYSSGKRSVTTIRAEARAPLCN